MRIGPLVGMMTRTSGCSCEATSFERICATLEDDWGLVVNQEPLPLNAASPIPTIIIAPTTATPILKKRRK